MDQYFSSRNGEQTAPRNMATNIGGLSQNASSVLHECLQVRRPCGVRAFWKMQIIIDVYTMDGERMIEI